MKKKVSPEIILNLFEIVGSEYCVAAEDGQIVFEQISSALKDNVEVVISFNNIKRLTSAFLNVAIGQLYGVYAEELIKELLRVQDISEDNLILLKRVVDTAKLYFKDREKFNQAREKALEG